MTKDQLVEKIKLEYDLYEVTDCLSCEELADFISGHHKDLDEKLDDFKSQKVRNNINRVASKSLGKYRNKKGLFGPEYYEQDNRLLGVGHNVVWNYRRCFFILADLLDEENVDEINKLARFTYDSYRRNYKGVCIARSIIKTDKPGLATISKTAPMDFRGFVEFFDEKVKTIPRMAVVKSTKQATEEEIESENVTEKLKLEYALFEDEDVYCLEDVLGSIKVAHEACVAKIAGLRAEKFKNGFDRVVSLALGQRRAEFDYVAPSEYNEDNQYIDLQIAMADKCLGYFEQLYGAANDDNIQGIYRLARFTAEKHGYNDIAVRQSRLIKRSQAAGFLCCASDVQMDWSGFDAFFGEALKDARSIENPQYFKN